MNCDLDLALKNQSGHIQTVYWKPTHTDLIIPNDLFHPFEHKKGGISHLITRVNNYSNSIERKPNELTSIREILKSNLYHPDI